MHTVRNDVWRKSRLSYRVKKRRRMKGRRSSEATTKGTDKRRRGREIIFVI